MKTPALFILCLLIGSIGYSQSSIRLEECSSHVGDSVTVCGPVASARYMESSKGQPTLLNIGSAYPNQALTIVIWADVRKDFDKAPEDFFMGKQVCVTGKVELYRDKPQIVIKTKNQLAVK